MSPRLEQPSTPTSSDPEKQLGDTLPHLTPVYSSGSTVEEALDAEANVAPPDPVTTVDTEKSDDDPGPPPNGGFKAWLQVLGSFFLFFNCW